MLRMLQRREIRFRQWHNNLSVVNQATVDGIWGAIFLFTIMTVVMVGLAWLLAWALPTPAPLVIADAAGNVAYTIAQV
jgi:hypothetical protein